MNLADAIPALLVVLLGSVLFMIVVVVALAVHLRRRSAPPEFRAAEFVPGPVLAKLWPAGYMTHDCRRSHASLRPHRAAPTHCAHKGRRRGGAGLENRRW